MELAGSVGKPITGTLKNPRMRVGIDLAASEKSYMATVLRNGRATPLCRRCLLVKVAGA